MTDDNRLQLSDYGWSNYFADTGGGIEFENTFPLRVIAVHRDALDAVGPDFSGRIRQDFSKPGDEARATIGDWIAVNADTQRMQAIYSRKSLFKRRTAGTNARTQLIAANVDTVFVVTSANLDFNVARLERYLAMAEEAGVTPILLITKIDLADDPQSFVDKAKAIRHDLIVEPINAREATSLDRLLPWLAKGQTVALMGSSGVGKSTIINSLLGSQTQETRGIREEDARGRHTTSGRSLHRIASGAWLMDTPGMREIQIVEVATGIDTVFDDITALAVNCRFSNCQHGKEPGCAVRPAIAAGTLDEDRLIRFQKLQKEERLNTEQIYEANARNKSSGKMARSAAAAKSKKWQDF